MLRRLGIGLAILVASFLSLIIIVVAAAQTGPGQRLIVRTLNATLADTVRIEGLSGSVPFDMQIEHLALLDQGEPWLTVEDFVFDWNPSRLFDGVVQIARLGAQRIEVASLPAGGPEEPAPESEEPFRLPELPESLPLIELDRLLVGELVLEQPVLGERTVFHIEGHASAIDQGQAVEAALEVARIDRRNASVGLNATLALEPPTLNLDLRASETGRLTERLAGLEESGDFDLRIVGNGPLSAWRAELTAGGAGIGRASGVITLALREQPRFGLDLQLHPGRAILPDEIRRVLGETVEVALDVTQTGAQQVRVHAFRTASGPLEAEASGAFDFEARTFDARADVDLARLAALEALAGMPLAGRLSARLTGEGAFLEPAGRLELAGEGLELQGARMVRFAADLDFHASGDLSVEPAGRAVLDGRIEGLEVDGAGLPARDLELALAVRRNQGAEALLEEFRLSDGNAALDVDGRIDTETLAGTFDVRLALERLAEFTGAAGQAVGGRLVVAGPVRIAEGAGRIATELEAAAEDLDGLPPDLAGLVGEQVKLALNGTFVPGESAVVDRLRLENHAFELAAEGELGLGEDRTVSAELALGIPELQVLERLVGSEMAGALAASATLSGTIARPALDLQLGGEDLVLAGRPVNRLELEAEATGIEPSQGRLQVDLAMPRLEAELATAYRFDGATLALEQTRLSGTGIEVEGDATVELASGLTTGRFEGRVEELARLEALVPVALRGRVELDVELEERDGSQSVAAAARAVDVRGPFGRIQRAALTAELNDVLAEPEVQAGLTVEDFRQETNRVERLEVTANGGLNELVVNLSTKGTASAAFDLEGRTVLALGDATRIRIERLDGTLGDQPLRLAQPATVALRDQTIELDALDLRYAGGQLRAAAKVGPGPVSGTVRIDGLPLQNLQSLGAPPLTGTLQASLDLSGAATDPNLALDLEIPNLRSPDPTLGDVPPLALVVDAALAGRRLDADLQASGLTETPITAEVALPLLLDLEQFAFELPQGGELSGALRADVQLQRIADLLVLDGQRLQGRLDARLDLGGTVAEPAVDGRIALDDGRYENGTTGTVLRQITLRADATADRLTIRELRATDGGNGRLAGGGTVELDPARNYPLDLRLELGNATLVRRDDARMTLGGEIRARGHLQRARVAGQIVIERAEVSLPDPSAGPDVAVLEVEEVGEGFGPAEDAAAAEEEDERVVLLDLAIRVPGRFYVRGRGLESEWQGRLQVEGTLDQPQLVGDLEIRRGVFDFLDRRFELERGTIGFTGGLPPTPGIDIRAVAEAEDVTAIVQATGTPDDLEIRLTSEPELPEDEVLSRLLFNRDVSNISPAEAASLALAVNRLRGGGGGLDILGRARRALGVDTLDVSGASGEETVKAGKYLSDDVYVEVEKGAGDQSGRARVELEVLPNVSIEADTGQDAKSGVGVKWKYDF